MRPGDRLFTPGGPLGYEPEPLGKLARNNVEWLYHNGARYWEGFKNGVHKHPLPLLFTAFMFGETAAATLFHSMHQRTTIPALKEAFRCIGQDEARHLGICLALLQKVMPALSDEDKARVTKQLRAGFVFLSGVLYEPPRISGSCRRRSRRRTGCSRTRRAKPGSACSPSMSGATTGARRCSSSRASSSPTASSFPRCPRSASTAARSRSTRRT